jgi:hypothetical protein
MEMRKAGTRAVPIETGMTGTQATTETSRSTDRTGKATGGAPATALFTSAR